MPRPPEIIRPVSLHTSVPEDLATWLTVHLWSKAEGRVPHGARQALILQLLREYRARFETREVSSDSES